MTKRITRLIERNVYAEPADFHDSLHLPQEKRGQLVTRYLDQWHNAAISPK